MIGMRFCLLPGFLMLLHVALAGRLRPSALAKRKVPKLKKIWKGAMRRLSREQEEEMAYFIDLPGVAMPKYYGNPDAGRKIVCIGDSLTAGWSNRGQRFFPYGKYMERKLKYHLGDQYGVVVDGVSGSLAKQWAEEEDPVISPCPAQGPGLETMINAHFRAKRAIIMLGTNDLGSRTPDQIKENVKQVHRRWHAKDVRTIMLSIPHAVDAGQNPAIINEINEDLEAWCRDRGDRVTFVDSSRYLTTPDPDEGRGGRLHYDRAAYRRLGNKLADVIAGRRMPDPPDNASAPGHPVPVAPVRQSMPESIMPLMAGHPREQRVSAPMPEPTPVLVKVAMLPAEHGLAPPGGGRPAAMVANPQMPWMYAAPQAVPQNHGRVMWTMDDGLFRS